MVLTRLPSASKTVVAMPPPGSCTLTTRFSASKVAVCGLPPGQVYENELENEASLTLASHRVPGRVLEQEHGVVGQFAGPPRQRDLLLQHPGVLVADRPQPRPAKRRFLGHVAHPAWAATACSWAW